MGYLGNAARRVELNGIDITGWVLDLPRTPTQKPDWGEIPSPDTLAIRVRSDDHAFDQIHPVSFLYGKRYDQLTIKVYEFDNLVWSGYLETATTDLGAGATTLTAFTVLQRKLNLAGRMDTSLLTPARAIARILQLHDIPIHAASIDYADDLLNDIPVRVRVAPSVLDWQGTLGDLLQTLATAGIGRIFQAVDGSIGFDTWEDDPTPVISYTITDALLMAWPDVEDESRDTVNGYSLTWAYGTETAGSGDSLQSMDFGLTSSVHVMEQGSAIYIGETWLKLAAKDYYQITLYLDKSYAIATVLGSYLQIDSEELGLNAPFEVLEIDNSDPKWVKVRGRVDKGRLSA